MTVEQRRLCKDLVITPPHGRSQISKEEFLRQFPSSVQQGKLALPLLKEAYDAHSPEDLECALLIGFTFGFGPGHREILSNLIEADWHHSHEDIVEALDTLRSPDAVDALFRATQWIPKSLEYDEGRALAVKAIWALGKIPGCESQAKLEMVARSDDPVVRETALEQLDRRQHQAP
jgi:hypothetical protein